MITVQQKIEFSRVRFGRHPMKAKPPQRAVVSVSRVPRISQRMALAMRFEGLARDGQVLDQSELARLAHVPQPRKNGPLAPVLRGEGWGEGQRGESEVVFPSRTRAENRRMS